MAEFTELELGDDKISTLRKRVLDELLQRGLVVGDLVYRGFNRDAINNVLNMGSENGDATFIYGNELDYLWAEGLLDPMDNPLVYTINHGP